MQHILTEAIAVGHLLANPAGKLQRLGKMLPRVTDKEITAQLRSIQRGEWLEIPMLVCWFALDGLFVFDQLHRGRRFEYNDEWDKYRAGDAFHSAHCFITDGGMASALRQGGLPNPDIFRCFQLRRPRRSRRI
jgi:hypothetical protein